MDPPHPPYPPLSLAGAPGRTPLVPVPAPLVALDTPCHRCVVRAYRSAVQVRWEGEVGQRPCSGAPVPFLESRRTCDVAARMLLVELRTATCLHLCIVLA